MQAEAAQLAMCERFGIEPTPDLARRCGYEVIQAGNVITSGTCPMPAGQTGRSDGIPESTQLLIDALG